MLGEMGGLVGDMLGEMGGLVGDILGLALTGLAFLLPSLLFFGWLECAVLVFV